MYQQKRHNGFIEKADLALAIALVLSLCTTILWAVYEIILEVVPPVPSLADALSIAAYAFLSFYVYSTYLRFHKVFHFSKKQLIAAVIASTIFLFFIILYTVNLVEISSSRGLVILSIIIAYPVLDAIIIGAIISDRGKLSEGTAMVHSMDLQVCWDPSGSDRRQLV